MVSSVTIRFWLPPLINLKILLEHLGELVLYRRIPFRLINAGATFERAIDIDFRGLMHNSIVVYLDDITSYSKRRHDHLFSLRHGFEICRKYSTWMNPKKSIFTVKEGNILGFIVLKDGMIINPKIIDMVAKIGLPSSNKSM